MERRMKFRVTGKGELMTHNPAAMRTAATGKGGKAGAASNIPTPDVEAERGLYLDGEGRFCIPGIAFRNAFVKAAGQFRGPWQKKRENLRALVAPCQVTPELIPILDGKGKPAKTYAIDTRRAVVQRQGILRSRPKFSEWGAAFEMSYDDDFLKAEEDVLRNLFVEILNDAGNRIGVMEYRPEKSGWFGRFSVE